MNQTSAQQQFYKFLIISLLCLGLVITYLSYQTLKIKQINCFYQDQACPPSIEQEVKDRLTGRSIFFTNLDKKLDTWKVTGITRTLPQTLEIRLQPTSTTTTQLTLDDLLDKYQIPVDHTEETDQTWIIYLTQQLQTDGPQLRALVDKNDLELSVFKLAQVLKQVDLKGIDLSITEIDARFRLVVLRTKYSPV